MNDVGNQYNRNFQIGQEAVGFLNQRQQSKLCNAEINDTADNGNDNRFGHGAAGVFLLFLFFRCQNS